jgi:F0F1-type ATP synthase delta subunit
MKDRKLFETVAEAGQIFAVGFDLTDLEDGTQDAEIRSYIEFNNITTNDAVKVIGDILGKFIHEASKKKDIRYAMAKTLIMHVIESMDEDESKRETKPETKPERKSDDASLEKIAETLGSIKSLLEVMKTLKED